MAEEVVPADLPKTFMQTAEAVRFTRIMDKCLNLVEGELDARDNGGKPSRGAVVAAGSIFNTLIRLGIADRDLQLKWERFKFEKESRGTNPLKGVDIREVLRWVAEWKGELPEADVLGFEEEARKEEQ